LGVRPRVDDEEGPGLGYWMASDGYWYPPETRPLEPGERRGFMADWWWILLVVPYVLLVVTFEVLAALQRP
jgi:hypothetical protein